MSTVTRWWELKIVNSKFFIILILIATLLVIFKNYSYESNSDTSDLLRSEVILKGNDAVGLDTNVKKEKFDKSDIQKAFAKCNNSNSIPFDFAEMIGKNLDQLSESQLSILFDEENFVYCERFEEYFSSLSDDIQINIEDTNKLSQKNTVSFLNMNQFDKLEISRSVAFGKSNEISRNAAIGYLLKNDDEIKANLAEKIGTENILLIESNRREFFNIYKCKSDPAICSVKGPLMAARCIYDSQYCGLDYYSYLNMTRTSNEVSDLYILADTLLTILNKDE